MATIKQFIGANTGASSNATQFKKSAKASALAFGRAGAFGEKAQKAAQKGNAGSMGR